MRILRWIGGVTVALAVVAGIGWMWKGEELRRLMVVNTLFEPDYIVDNFSNMREAFLTVELPRGDGPVSPLPQGEEMVLPDGVADWVEDRNITSLLVLKDGTIRHQSYYLGTGEYDLRISWSVAKSYLSALFGVIIADGDIDSLDDPVTKYAPELIGTAYDGASIRNVLNMASGVTFNEDYFDRNSDINRMGRVLALGQTLDDFTTELTETFAPPGETWQYVSIDTHVLGMVIRGATGRSVADLLSEKIIAPLGLERDGYYVTDGAGVAFVLGGLNFITRDYARFGQMILQDGAYNGQQVVPADWVAASTAATAPTQEGKLGYGFQWWFPKDARPGEVFGNGVYGQALYLDRDRNVVIMVTGADRRFREPGATEQKIDVFRKIAQALAP